MRRLFSFCPPLSNFPTGLMLLLFMSTAVAASQDKNTETPDAIETQYLNDLTQLLKQEVIDLGLKVAKLAWVGSLPAAVLKSKKTANTIDRNLVSIGQTLARLEDGLLTPPGRQLVIFISSTLKRNMNIQSVTLDLDHADVRERNYTPLENDVMRAGGAHRIFMTSIPEGPHRLDIIVRYTYRSKSKAPYKQTVTFNKTFERHTIEFKMSSNTDSLDAQTREWD